MVYSRIVLYISVAATLIFLLSGYGYRWDIWSLGLAFTLLIYSAYVAIGVAIISLISLWFLRKGREKAIVYLVISLLLTGSVTIGALYWRYRGQSAPPIHDITTDIENPPAFSAIVRLRADAPNPYEYSREESADAQREAYPQIQPLELSADVQDVMDSAVLLVNSRRWKLAAINRKEGRIEATETLPWFGFKDDVVLRFTEMNGGTRVDMRSESRIGRGDLGVNARRVDDFLDDLRMSLK